jgi:hypothetical protein
MMYHLTEPYTLYLSLKYKYHKLNRITSLSIAEYIDGHRPFDPTNPGNLEMEPYTFRDRHFLFYTFLDLWLDTGEPFETLNGSFEVIENINQSMDEEFAFQSFLYNASIAKSRLSQLSRLPTLAKTQRVKLHRGSLVSKSAKTPKLHWRETLNSYDLSIQKKGNQYRERERPDLKQNRMAAFASIAPITAFAIAYRTQIIVEEAAREIGSAKVDVSKLDGVLSVELLDRFKIVCGGLLSSAKAEIGRVVVEAKQQVDLLRRPNEQARKKPRIHEMVSVMAHMMTSNRLQEISKQLAEQSWVSAMAQLYIKDAIQTNEHIVRIQSVVDPKLSRAITILEQLPLKEKDATLAICKEYKERIPNLYQSSNAKILQSIEDPSQAKENTEPMKSFLFKAMVIQRKVDEYVKILEEDLQKYRDKIRERLLNRSRQFGSIAMNPRGRSRERLSVPIRSKERSKERSRDRVSGPTASKSPLIRGRSKERSKERSKGHGKLDRLSPVPQ